MNHPAPESKALEELWRQRLNDAKLRLDFARDYLREVASDLRLREESMNSDGSYAYERAIRSENSALQAYQRVMNIYHDLTVRGTIPDEAEWLKRRATGANGSNGGGDSST